MQTKEAPTFRPLKYSSDKANEAYKHAHESAIKCCLEYDKDYSGYRTYLIGALVGSLERALK